MPLVTLLLLVFPSPLGMSLGLMAVRVWVRLVILLGLKDAWPALMLILVFVGGVLVLFIYVSSVALNEGLRANLVMAGLYLPLRVTAA
jgi:NADH-ubiquinone oxidoreductase chain 6